MATRKSTSRIKLDNQPFITIDPSSRSMGVAFWTPERELPLTTLLLRTDRDDDWTVSANCIGRELLSHFNRSAFKYCFCEMPAYMAGSHQTAASGALVKLTHSAGLVAGLCLACNIEFFYVPINIWKGNLPKEVVVKRIRQRLHVGEDAFKADIWDAVGIGLYVRGLF